MTPFSRRRRSPRQIIIIEIRMSIIMTPYSRRRRSPRQIIDDSHARASRRVRRETMRGGGGRWQSTPRARASPAPARVEAWRRRARRETTRGGGLSCGLLRSGGAACSVEGGGRSRACAAWRVTERDRHAVGGGSRCVSLVVAVVCRGRRVGTGAVGARGGVWCVRRRWRSTSSLHWNAMQCNVM